ncbi:MAG: type I-U CRISPR-associated protein Cas7, partial [Lentisphaeria bacterium]|nr:type I-U CRISPR-associated protein Cas7 [Lentisphaeria bacterium]
ALRLRTACDLEPAVDLIAAARPSGFEMPSLKDLAAELKDAIDVNKSVLKQTVVTFEDDLKKGKNEKTTEEGE